MLSAEAERLFWRLTTVADDHGRFEAEPMVVMADCFKAMLHRVTIARVAKWLDDLRAAGLISVYRVGEKTLGEFTSWVKHQRARPDRVSKYPPPSAATGGQVPPLSACSTGVQEYRIPSTGKPENGASAPPHTPAAIAFEIPESVQQALGRAPILGAVKRLQEPAWWQAQVRANGRRGIDFAAELLKAEAWLTTNPRRAPKHDHARFLHTWLGRAEGPNA